MHCHMWFSTGLLYKYWLYFFVHVWVFKYCWWVATKFIFKQLWKLWCSLSRCNQSLKWKLCNYLLSFLSNWHWHQPDQPLNHSNAFSPFMTAIGFNDSHENVFINSVDNPVQYWYVLITTWKSFINLYQHLNDIHFMFPFWMYIHFVYKLWPEAAKYGTIYFIDCKWSSQFPVISAFLNCCNMPIISSYTICCSRILTGKLYVKVTYQKGDCLNRCHQFTQQQFSKENGYLIQFKSFVKNIRNLSCFFFSCSD